jgi:enamine deaminase RidA (YjgF/YER057c/UK114 family)
MGWRWSLSAKERPEMQITPHNPLAVHAPSSGYSMGVELSQHRRLLFVSGQVPERADGSLPEGFEAQCEQAWATVLAALQSASLGVEHLVKINSFLTDRNQVAANRAIRRRMLQGHEPASTTVVVNIVESRWLLEKSGRANSGPGAEKLDRIRVVRLQRWTADVRTQRRPALSFQAFVG